MKKTILITGCTSGIGKKTCYELLKKNNFVIGVGRNDDNITEFNQEFKSNFLFIKADLVKDIDEIYTKITKLGIKLDSLILCAGKEETIPLTLYKKDKVREILEINVVSQIEMIRQFSRKKMSNEGSSIVLISSVMSILGQPGKIGYCTSKSAILGLTRSAALELSNRKIRVNAISPGVVKTPMTEKLFSQLNLENIDKIVNMHPLGLGDTIDIFNCINFLISKESRWITGQNIIIDGGYSIH